jgi:hypothetical protein
MRRGRSVLKTVTRDLSLVNPTGGDVLTASEDGCPIAHFEFTEMNLDFKPAS